MNIVLVEDDQWLGECYCAWLRAAGHRVVWARDAQGALDALDQARCDAIVLDIFLPGANGLQLLTVLASHLDTVVTPVIVCTSHTFKGSPPWQAYGVRRVLNKTTLTEDEFVQAVQGVT